MTNDVLLVGCIKHEVRSSLQDTQVLHLLVRLHKHHEKFHSLAHLSTSVFFLSESCDGHTYHHK